jgi:hypothetical protein
LKKGSEKKTVTIRNGKGEKTSFSFFAQGKEPICPMCGVPLIKTKPYTYKGDCVHIPKNIIIGVG